MFFPWIALASPSPYPCKPMHPCRIEQFPVFPIPTHRRREIVRPAPIPDFALEAGEQVEHVGHVAAGERGQQGFALGFEIVEFSESVACEGPCHLCVSVLGLLSVSDRESVANT